MAPAPRTVQLLKRRPPRPLNLTAHHFPEQREFYRHRPKSLRASLCSRRAGKTRGGNESDLELASQTQDGRFLYVNETRAEAKRLAWIGARGDGMASMVRNLGLVDDGIAVTNDSEMSIHFPKINSWIYLMGVDDEHAVTKALGMPWNRVRWDEAQRIPPKFTETIRETLLPTLLDYNGELLLTGTPERKMSGLFYDVTRPEVERRTKGWELYRWTLIQNPYWGRAKVIDGETFVVWGARDEIVNGPHPTSALPQAILDARHEIGVIGLQTLLGGPDVAGLESPIMRRQAGGQWTREDSNYVYAVNKLREDELYYAAPRTRDDGFPDVAACLADLPGDWREYAFSMSVDLGYNDPFAVTVWAWSGRDPNLYELLSWKKSGLDSDDQNHVMQEIRAAVVVGQITADAGGIGKQVTKGWSKEWVTKYNLPIVEAEKQHKLTAITTYNADILKRHVKFREGGVLIEEMKELQWATIVSGSGAMLEDPTMANDVCDSSLYGHRHSYQFRWRAEDVIPAPGTPERFAREAKEIEDDMIEDAGGRWQ